METDEMKEALINIIRPTINIILDMVNTNWNWTNFQCDQVL